MLYTLASASPDRVWCGPRGQECTWFGITCKRPPTRLYKDLFIAALPSSCFFSLYASFSLPASLTVQPQRMPWRFARPTSLEPGSWNLRSVRPGRPTTLVSDPLDETFTGFIGAAVLGLLRRSVARMHYHHVLQDLLALASRRLIPVEDPCGTRVAPFSTCFSLPLYSAQGSLACSSWLGNRKPVKALVWSAHTACATHEQSGGHVTGTS